MTGDIQLMSKKLIYSLSMLILAFLAVFSAFGNPADDKNQLQEGIGLFKTGQYGQAVLSFRNVILSPQDSPYKPDAYFWISKSYLAIQKLDDAERNLEFFLNNYPYHPYFSEGLYQKGRLLFLQKDPESAIQVFQSFMSQYPGSSFVPNSLFWIGESLYELGRLEEAALIFARVAKDFPRSFKVEPARYRLSMIEFKKRENEILKLLKWSHEESLKVVEEFQRREKAYEQAISAYQRKLSGLTPGDEQSSLEKMREKIEALRRENDSLKGEIETLKRQPSNLSEQGSLEKEDLAEKRRELLEIKQEALAVKESFRKWLESNPENR